MKKIVFIVALLCMSCFFELFGKRFLLDSEKNYSKKSTRAQVVSIEPEPRAHCVCVTQSNDANDEWCNNECGRPEKICSNKNRIKSEYFRYGPYVYPYTLNQPGFYFGVGIPRAHYW